MLNNTATLGIVFAVTWLLFAVPAVVFLLRSYIRSRMSGFLWLAAALFLWPFFGHLVGWLLPILSPGLLAHDFDLGVLHLQGYLFSPLLQSIGGGLLILIATYVLDRELAARLPPAPPRP